MSLLFCKKVRQRCANAPDIFAQAEVVPRSKSTLWRCSERTLKSSETACFLKIIRLCYVAILRQVTSGFPLSIMPGSQRTFDIFPAMGLPECGTSQGSNPRWGAGDSGFHSIFCNSSSGRPVRRDTSLGHRPSPKRSHGRAERAGRRVTKPRLTRVIEGDRTW
jgi:hypothetical protein